MTDEERQAVIDDFAVTGLPLDKYLSGLRRSGADMHRLFEIHRILKDWLATANR